MILENINENRELYDLCRKYKFYYSQYHEIKNIDKRFYNKHINKAAEEAEQQLNKTLLEMLHYIFKNTGALTKVKIETTDPFTVKSFLGEIQLNSQCNVTHISSPEFALLMSELLHMEIK